MAKRASVTVSEASGTGSKRVRLASTKGAGKDSQKQKTSSQQQQKPGILKKGKENLGDGNGESPAAIHSAKGKGKSTAIESEPVQLRARLLVDKEPVPKPATAFEVIVGSYERLLYGLHCNPSGSGSSATIEVEPVFQFPAHLTCVKTVHASPNGRWLATGAADEVIKVWDLKRRKEIGGLLGHEGDITSLLFPSDKYMLSTSADGTLSLFRTRDWSLLRKFKGHKGPVKHAAVHPSGRVALSVGKDRCLRMWDLLGKSTNKSSTSTKLGAEADLVRWNTKGNKIAVLLDREVRIYTIDMVQLHTLSSRSRFHDIQFIEVDGTEVFLVACEDGTVRLYKGIADSIDSEDGELASLDCFAELIGHKNRVKAISIVTVLGQQFATTASSDGTVKVYSLAGLSTLISSGVVGLEEFSPITSFDTKGSRLTCLAAVAVTGDRTTAGSALGHNGSDDDDSDSDTDSEVEGDILAIAEGELGEDGQSQQGEGDSAEDLEDPEEIQVEEEELEEEGEEDDAADGDDE